MTKARICKIALCVLFVTPLAPLAGAKAQSPAPIMGTDPQPIKPNVMGTDPQPIKPSATGAATQIISPTLISILVSLAVGVA